MYCTDCVYYVPTEDNEETCTWNDWTDEACDWMEDEAYLMALEEEFVKRMRQMDTIAEMWHEEDLPF